MSPWELAAFVMAGVVLGIVLRSASDLLARRPQGVRIWRCSGCGQVWYKYGRSGTATLGGWLCLDCIRAKGRKMGLGE